jgi:tRNA (guanine37-N1)-methyltransferase
MNFCILSLFPEMFRGFVDDSVLKRGQESGAISISTKDIRDYSTNKHKKVDDMIYGGGPGMLIKPEPLSGAILSAREEHPNAKVVYLSPSGELFTQKKAEQMASSGEDLILICGRYEGVDQRIRATMVDEELSIGEYVLSGGEIAAAVVIDAVARLVPGVVGKQSSVETESFSRNIFRNAEFPQFTRPKNWQGLSVPKVLLSGDHAKIEKWQLDHLPGLLSIERKTLDIRRNHLPAKTRNLILRNHEETDIDRWVQWVNDPEVTRFLSISPPLTREDEEDFYESCQENLRMLPISICEKKTKKPIGTAALEISMQNEKRARFGILIGEKKSWNKGYGQEILREMMKIGFEEMDLECIVLDVFVENIAAQKCYEKCGMKQVGKFQKYYQKPDAFHDVYLYEMTKEDFVKNQQNKKNSAESARQKHK